MPDLQKIQIIATRAHGNRIVITVLDTGVGGIDLDDQDKYFEPFSQIKEVTWLDAPDGLGIGLCITRYLVELMGGTIKFVNPATIKRVDFNTGNSGPYKTAIQINIPEMPPGDVAVVPPNRQVVERPKPHVKRSANFVLIDDNIANLELLELLIRDKILSGDIECDIVSFNDPILAKNHLMQPTVNDNTIVLADVKMPHLNGFSLLQELITSNGPGYIPPPFIYVTALNPIDVTNRIKYMNSQYPTARIHFIYKPIDVKHLEVTLNTVMNSLVINDSILQKSDQERTFMRDKLERLERPEKTNSINRITTSL